MCCEGVNIVPRLPTPQQIEATQPIKGLTESHCTTLVHEVLQASVIVLRKSFHCLL